MWIMYGATAYQYNLFTMVSILFTIGIPFIFIALDSLYKADIEYSSLPVKRSTIVYARYVSSSLSVIAGLILTIIIGFVFKQFFTAADKGFELLMTIRGLISFILIVTLPISYLLPFIFKFGFGKGLWVASSISMMIVILILIVKSISSFLKGYQLFNEAFFSKLLNEILEIIKILGKTGVLAVIFFIIGTLVLISIKLSVRFYSKRDL